MEDETIHEARKHLAHYRAGLNYRRGYLDALKSQYSSQDFSEQELVEIEGQADEAARKFLEALK